MRVTVVTAVLNRAAQIGDCLRSVAAQRHPDVEHVVIDGGSSDGTVEVVQAHREAVAHFVSEKDAGLYHAINKGIAAATGDVIGILGSDDVYATDETLGRIVDALERTGAEACYGDLLYVRSDLETVVRSWRSSPYRSGGFSRGWMPPHPTFFVRRETYERLGTYDTRFRIAADYELMLRFIERARIQTCHVPDVLVKMRVGGSSNRRLNLARKSAEDVAALLSNGYWAAPAIVALKNARKIPQLFRRAP